MSYNLIGLRDSANIIGYQNELLYRIDEDMEFFKTITTVCSNKNKTNAVLMGYNTWLSIPNSFRPLKNRLNVVLSKDHCNYHDIEKGQNILFRNNFEVTISELERMDNIESIFIIGGSQIYQQALQMNRINKIYLTEIHSNLFSSLADKQQIVYFPYFNVNDYDKITSEIKDCNLKLKLKSDSSLSVQFNQELTIHLNYQFCTYIPIIRCPKSDPFLNTFNYQNDLNYCNSLNIDEQNYLNLLSDVRHQGQIKEGRNGKTYSLFGKKLEFNLSNNTIPILTTKKMAVKTCIKELLWFISGNTSNQILNQQNVNIWNGNSSREFLDKLGLIDRNEGDLGPIYGFQWRHSGAEYINCDTNYTNQGIDQLQNSIDLLKSDPNSRRNIVSAWNPKDLHLMALPPCHVLFQWYVENDKLSLQLYQRSGDVFLGVPFNIFSYSLLIHMVAHLTGLKAHKFIHILGDVHAYEQHLEAINTQILRKPLVFPKVRINGSINSINMFKLDNFEIINYHHLDSIKAPMIA